MEDDFELLPEPAIAEPEGVAPKLKLCIVAAIGKNRELGKNNQLLWHQAEDMRFFKEITVGHYVIMGRKSFESIPKKYRPLPERVNIIISRDAGYMAEECYTCTSVEEALVYPKENGEIRSYLIGGGQIYKLALEAGLVDEMFLTHVQAGFPDADVFFPEFNESEWKKTHVKSGVANSENEFDFDIYLYEKKSSLQSDDGDKAQEIKNDGDDETK